MGIIQKQTIKGTVYTYLGVALGFVNIGLLTPKIFSTDQIGLTNILVAISAIFAQFASLGVNNVTTRLFPYFRDEKKKNNGYLFILLMVVIIGFVLSLFVFHFLKPMIISRNIHKSSLIVRYINYLIPLILFTLIFNVLDVYNKALYDAVLGTFLKEFVFRILNFIIIIFFYFNIIDFDNFVLLYVISLSTPAVVIIFILIIRKQFSLKPNLSYIKKNMAKIMISVGLFGIIAGLSGIAIINIDKLMVNDLLDLKATGIYSITFFFGSLIIIPSRALKKISSTLIADAWKNNDTQIINKIYYKSSINQFIIGSLIFIGIWANIDNIFRIILPPEFISGKYVIFFIALANLFEMISGVSSSIIQTSKKYKYQTYFMIILVFLVVITNYIFIPIYGIKGAAIASAISTFVFVSMRYIFVLRNFKMQPLKINHIFVIIISVVSYFAADIIPLFNNVFFDIIIRSGIIVIIYGVLIILFKVSDDINLKLIKNFFKDNFSHKK